MATEANASASHSTPPEDVPLDDVGQEFPLFPKFPAEVRQLIWEIASNEPRTIIFNGKTQYRGLQIFVESLHNVPNMRVDDPEWIFDIPSVLHTNQESRIVAERFLKPIFSEVVDGKSPYINFAVDTFLYPGFDLMTNLMNSFPHHKRDSLRNIVQFFIDLRHFAQPGSLGLDCSTYFSNLETITLSNSDSRAYASYMTSNETRQSNIVKKMSQFRRPETPVATFRFIPLKEILEMKEEAKRACGR